MPNSYYFRGDLYSAKWLVESVKAGKLVDKDDFFLREVNGKGIKRFDLVKGRVKYTMTEALKVFEIAAANRKKNNTSANFWKEIEALAIFPNRPSESLRNFYKHNSQRGVEEYIKE